MKAIANMTRPKGDPTIVRTGPSSLSSTDRLARNLGWFSIGLGLTELLAARRLSRMLGLEDREALIRAYGAREIGAGVVTLSTEKQVGLWARVAGDALDIATLAPALSRNNPKRDRVKLALAVVAGVTALDLLAARFTAMSTRRRPGAGRSYADRSGFPAGLAEARRSGNGAGVRRTDPLAATST